MFREIEKLLRRLNESGLVASVDLWSEQLKSFNFIDQHTDAIHLLRRSDIENLSLLTFGMTSNLSLLMTPCYSQPVRMEALLLLGMDV